MLKNDNIKQLVKHVRRFYFDLSEVIIEKEKDDKNIINIYLYSQVSSYEQSEYICFERKYMHTSKNANSEYEFKFYIDPFLCAIMSKKTRKELIYEITNFIATKELNIFDNSQFTRIKN